MRGDIRQCGLPGYELGDYIREAIDFLRRHEPPEGYFVGFSSGKDSIVSLVPGRTAGGNHPPYYTQTGIDPPDIMSFIKTHYPQVQWLRPAKSFFACIQTKAPPLRTQRWCCEYIKERPSWSVPQDRRVLGIRAEESKERANLGRINPRKIRGGRVLTAYHPIYLWPEWAVWDFIDARRLSVPSLYDEGFGRIGCIPCPYSVLGSSAPVKARRAYSMSRWPGVWTAFERATKRWWAKKRQGRDPVFNTAADYWRAYLNGFE